MGMQQFTPAELTAKAEQLGILQPGNVLSAAMASKVKAAIVEERRAVARQEAPALEARLAKEIVVDPGGAILIDGEPFPWLVAKQAMDVTLNPHGVSTVRLTLLAESVQILKPKTDSTESE